MMKYVIIVVLLVISFQAY
ncbi:type I toxin-antitoxin system Ibs family toxin [Escherichia coli]|nr:type I toxin-antitoxin system Ibs family toxin [Escherichia coli]